LKKIYCAKEKLKWINSKLKILLDEIKTLIN